MLTDSHTHMHAGRVRAGLAGELTEALRLILEPTRATRLAGEFRSGKRLAMRRVIAYIASHFRRDKIWLRRTRPDRRAYQVRQRFQACHQLWPVRWQLYKLSKPGCGAPVPATSCALCLVAWQLYFGPQCTQTPGLHTKAVSVRLV
jgi:hypothetical protein